MGEYAADPIISRINSQGAEQRNSQLRVAESLKGMTLPHFCLQLIHVLSRIYEHSLTDIDE
jgi:hypothetical protein